MNINEKYSLWCEKAIDDKDLIADLLSIKDDENEKNERFSRDLEFGTAGLRGIIGAGSFRMNIYTIRRATQGLAEYILATSKNPSCAIAYDSRIKSDLFAKESAMVLAANGVKAYIFSELQPTPTLSFAVRELNTTAGINVTASHNPSKYNGYKVYGSDGCQMTELAASKVYQNILNVDTFAVKTMNFDEGVKNGMINIIGQEVVDKFLDCVEQQVINPEISKNSDLKVIYTPLNGAGNKCVRNILNRIGIKNVKVVAEQEFPDGNFPTCPYPNPEIKQVFECGLKLAKEEEPDLLLATDPDSDRVGIAVKDGDDYRLFSGNEVGAMLLNYIASQRKENGTMPQNPLTVKTIVTTPLINAIAKKYDVEVVNCLTGFKYIGEIIGNLESKNQENRYIFGFEESYGYLAGSYVRDKDAVVGSMLICDMAAYYKTKGKNLVDVINDIYEEFGYYLNVTDSYEFDGLAGLEKMKTIMQSLRDDALTEIAGIKVDVACDYKSSKKVDYVANTTETIELPESNVLSYDLANGSSVIVRPSGTEPKIKVYISSYGTTKESALKLESELKCAINKILGF